jgi:hypothetical protein
MVDTEQARLRRDRGLAKVGRWTRYSVAAGVVLSGVFGAGIAHRLPGQSAAAEHPHPPAVPDQGPATPPSPGPGSVDGTGQKSRRLAPPSQAPRPAPAQSEHATSGGS